jgi:fibronectin type 3 domain-containing protein
MKKRILGVMACLLAVFAAGCSNFNLKEDTGDKPEQPVTPPVDSSKTWARFDNSNEFAVSVYSDRSRLSKIADAGADGQSVPVEMEPNSTGALFYPTWHIVMEGVDIPYEGQEIIHRVDAGKPRETPNVIPILSLSELGDEELSKSISGAVYLKIHNAGTSSLVLRQGNTEKFPQGARSTILNGGETGVYMVNSGLVSTYSVMKNTSIPVNFPGTLTEFVSGRLYSLRFDGTNLAVAADKKLSLAEAFAVSPPDTLNARTLYNGNIALSWNRAGSETAYRLYRADQDPVTFNFLADVVGGVSYTDTTVVQNTTYYYKISSVKKNIEGEKSAFYASAFAGAETSAIAPPAGLSAAVLGADSIQLSWSPVVGAASYAVYRGSSAADVTVYVASTASTTYTVTSLLPDTGYYFAVCAEDSAGESAPSSSVYGRTSSSGDGGTIPYPPAAPSGLVVSSAGSGSITLSWNSSATAVSYNIYRSTTKDGAAGKIATVTNTTYTDTVSPGASCYYTVAAVNSSGESSKSNMAFGVGSSHYMLSSYGGAQTVSLGASTKHYYRLAVTAGSSYTIQWQDGNSQNADYYVRAYAWQNDGTVIFDNQNNGYTSPRVFTAASSGYVTVMVYNHNSSNSYNYQIYYY